MTDSIYREHILDHARHPRNKGSLVGSTHEAREANPRCGDVCTFAVRVVDGVVAAAMFDGVGCALATASASLLTEHIACKRMAEAQRITEQDFLETLGVAVTSGRIDCALLPLRTLKKALL